MGKTKYASVTVHELKDDPHPIQREFFDFYRTPRGEFTPAGSSPAVTAHPTLSSNVKVMKFLYDRVNLSSFDKLTSFLRSNLSR